MNVLLLHDPREHPIDLFQALASAGHRVASHGGDANALPEFLAAMTWSPEAFVVDFRGGAPRALDIATGIAERGSGALLVLVHAPGALAGAPRGARFAADAAGAVAALAEPAADG